MMFLKLAPSAACIVGEERMEGREGKGRTREVGELIFKITAPLICDIQKTRRNKFQKITFILQGAAGVGTHTHTLIFLTF